MIYIREDMRPLFEAQRSVEDFLAIEGELFKEMPGRRTMRFECGGRRFFIKKHWGVGWGEIVKNLVSLKLPVVGARSEWQAIGALERLGVQTMKLVAYGSEGVNPARIRSFVMTEALENTEHLESWLPVLMAHEDVRARTLLKRAVLHRVATVARRLHENGINHRDMYLCHFRIDLSDAHPLPDPEHLHIYLIDLHRVQVRTAVPERWVVKDVAALLYSALFSCPGLRFSRSDAVRFIKDYRGPNWRENLASDRQFWEKVLKRTFAMCARSGNDTAPLRRLTGTS